MGKGRVIPVVVVVGVIALVVGAAAVDARVNDGRPARRLELAGRGLGGLPEPALRATVADIARSYRDAHVVVRSPAGDLDQTAAGVGLHLDEQATVAAALAVDEGSAWTWPARWVRSLFVGRASPLVFTVDDAQLTTGVLPLWQANHVDPVEPGLSPSGATMAATGGKQGADVDLVALAARLREAAATGATPIVVDVAPGPTDPRFSDADAQQLAAETTGITQANLAIQLNGKTLSIQPTTVRSWLRSVAGPERLEVQVDQAKLVEDIAKVGGQVGTPPVPVGFTLVGDQVQVVDGQNGNACCAPDSGARVVAALQTGSPTVALDMVPVPPAHDGAWAASMGITTKVAEFTTRHPCCAPRVTNIHLFADAMRGQVVEPGQVLSLNERVGQRTAEKGYVEAPVIYDAVMSSDVGGGVSQFATTIFNAAFFAGLDFEAYQSHSEFIDRYPYGREATISWPSPDLKIKNATPYGVMVWTSYDDTSVTVSLWSTPWVRGEQSAQSEEPKGPCKRVRTERTRTYADGRVETDAVFAVYQPAEGVRCP